MTNNLKVLYPEIFDEIIHELYEEDFLNKLTFGSGRKLEWKCKNCSHTWTAVISDRTRKGNRASGCPKCKETIRRKNLKKANVGINDLQTNFPEIFKELDISLNIGMDLNSITYASSQYVWWRCKKCDNTWNAKVSGRTDSKRPRGCPKCANITRGEKSSRATIGINDLQSTFPNLFEELHKTKNSDIDVIFLSYGSIKKVWWMCSQESCGYEWRTSPLKRTWQDTGCPRCCESNGSSKQEQEVYDFIAEYISSYMNLGNIEILQNDRSTILNPHTGRFLELDIYIPELKIAFEYNGKYWHNDENIDLRTKGVFDSAVDYHNFKSDLCFDLGIQLLHIYENDWVNSQETEKTRIMEFILQDILLIV